MASFFGQASKYHLNISHANDKALILWCKCLKHSGMSSYLDKSFISRDKSQINSFLKSQIKLGKFSEHTTSIIRMF